MGAYERTGGRDQELSSRHREWGYNCPTVDLDFTMVEYNHGLPVALVDYKFHKAAYPDLRHPTYRALRHLADYHSPPLPFIISFYWKAPWNFYVIPVNSEAMKFFNEGSAMTEREYVSTLYRIRKKTVEEVVLSKLDNFRLPEWTSLPIRFK